MAQNAANIHIGAGLIYIGGVAPVTGDPPTLTAHTNGVPSTPQTGFTEVGHTYEESIFEYTPQISDLESEQAFGVVDSYPTGQSCSLTFTCQERVYIALRTAFGGISSVSDGSKMLFYGGGAYSVLSQCVILSAKRRDVAAKWEILTIYKAQSIQGVRLSYSRKNPSRYQVVLRGVHDTTRTVNDQLFQLFREV